MQAINECKFLATTCGIVGCASTCAAGYKWYSRKHPKKHLRTKENNSMTCIRTSEYNIVYVWLVCNYLLRCTCRFWCVLCKFTLLFVINRSATTQKIKVGHVPTNVEA